jgi:cyclopropane fatty-acyl-phospholipid synthase-like methyltransferase
MSCSHHEPKNKGQSRDMVMEIFRRHWDIYRKVQEYDYMCHEAAYGRLNEILNAEIDRHFSFADLACGDAYFSSRCLANTSVSEYTGIDLSEWALSLAEKELERIPTRHRLIAGDFVDFDKYMDTPPDIVWVGMSVHHLNAHEKKMFMKKVRRTLSRNGVFIIYEPTLEEGEDGTTYFDRFEDTVKYGWTALSLEELDALLEHVRKSDIPELPSDWLRLGKEAGFGSAETVFTDPDDLYSIFKYR